MEYHESSYCYILIPSLFQLRVRRIIMSNTFTYELCYSAEKCHP